MIVGGQTGARARLSSSIIHYHAPFDQALMFISFYMSLCLKWEPGITNTQIIICHISLKFQLSKIKDFLNFKFTDKFRVQHTHTSKTHLLKLG